MKQATHKKCRRYGVRLCQTAKCPVARRPFPPGVHGPKGTPKVTGYGKQLAEKQKARYTYGLLERQFRNYFEKALKKVGNTTDGLFALLENRLDNTVYRLGFAATRSQARQLVNHGHFLVNAKPVDVPSYQVKVGDVISLRERSLKSPLFAKLEEQLQQKEKESSVAWLNMDIKAKTGKVTGVPTLGEVELGINWRMIVEFYSR